MNIYQFMSSSPFLTFFLAIILLMILQAVGSIIALPFRAMNIRKHGWPPEYLDADGDNKGEKK